MNPSRERIPLGQRLGWPLPADAPVATDAGNAEFLARVAAWQRAFAGREGAHHALYLEDGLEFAAALFGAWLCGKPRGCPATGCRRPWPAWTRTCRGGRASCPAASFPTRHPPR